ncbi:MAG TPA: hypothetical protein VGC55_05515 [Dokdonella sp.]
MNDPSVSARPGLRERLREKLPEIVIEAGSVVLALLLALALNQWNERQQENERAEIARNAILAELRANRQEIDGAHAKLQGIVTMLRDALDTSKPPPHELQVQLGISLLSAAAWHATLATQASQRIDFAWLTRIAKVYELQDNFLRVQNAAVDQLSAVPPDDSVNGKQIAALLLPRFSALDQLAQGLALGYAETLDGTAAKSTDTKP